MSTEPDHRPDVDGLRAVAVLSVVVYHAFPGLVPGGYVGVDVFFVISGFLITRLLLRDLAEGRFSLIDFWQRRIRRIFPALLLVLWVLLVVGWVWLLPADFSQLARHTLAASGFFSNIALWLEAGYFDTESSRKLLLHTWSLAIEEQFYLFWPLGVAAVARLSWLRRHLLAVLLAVALASWALNLLAIGVKPVATFFLLPTRLWELAAGACLAAWLRRPGATGTVPAPACSGAAGSVLLLGSLALLNEQTVFPGWAATAPVLGAVLLLAAGHTGRSPVNRVLAWGPLVQVGRISYSLYLWHWPLLALVRQSTLGTPSDMAQGGALLLSGLLAWASWRWVEQPARHPRGPARRLALGLLLAMGFTAGVAAWLARPPMQAQLDPLRPVMQQPAVRQLSHGLRTDRDWRQAHPAQACDTLPQVPAALRPFCQWYPAPGGPGEAAPGLLAVWGDSHALAWTPAAWALAQSRGWGLVVLAHTGCAPLLHVRRTDGRGDMAHCSSLAQGQDVVNTLHALQPRHVFLTARWGMYAWGLHREGQAQSTTHLLTDQADGPATVASSQEALQRQLPATLAALAQGPQGLGFTVLHDIPELQTDVAKGIARGLPLGQAPAAQRQHTRWVRELLESTTDHRLDLTGSFCPPEASGCRHQLDDGTLLYTDDNHISAQGALALQHLLAPRLRAAAGAPG